MINNVISFASVATSDVAIVGAYFSGGGSQINSISTGEVVTAAFATGTDDELATYSPSGTSGAGAFNDATATTPTHVLCQYDKI